MAILIEFTKDIIETNYENNINFLFYLFYSKQHDYVKINEIIQNKISEFMLLDYKSDVVLKCQKIFRKN